MKRNLLFYVSAVLIMASASCSKEEQDWYNSATTEPVVGINDDQLLLTGKSESSRISIESNMWWTAKVEYAAGSEEWCVLSPTKGYGNIEIDVTSTRNFTRSERTAKIIIEGDDRNTPFRKEFTVTQSPSEPYIEIRGMEETTTLEVPLTKSSNVLEILSNGEWTVTSAENWCTVEGTGNSGVCELKVDCAINTSGAERTSMVTLVSKDNPQIRKEIEVLQNDKFGTTIITLAKTETEFSLSWTPVVGAAGYQIIIKDAEDAEVATIDAGTETTYDLASDVTFAKPLYAGYVKVAVKTLSEDVSIFSVSEVAEANSHFTSGKGTQSDPFIIGDAASLANITVANSVLAGKYYRLEMTPDMSIFSPICSVGDPFSGIFDGNGKTISGWNPVVLADETNCYGFFASVAAGAEISNLKFQNCSFSLTKGENSVSSSNNGFGFVAGINSGSICDIALSSCSVSTEAGTTPLFVGGVAGVNNGTISDVTVTGGRLSAASDRNKTDEFNCGGITGYNSATGTVSGCSNGAEILAMNYVGGIAGYNDGVIDGCVNSGKITANYYFGGIAGYVKTTGKSTFQIRNCINRGTLVMDEPSGFGRGAAYVGGITSRVHCTTAKAILNCCNTGEMIIGASASSSKMRIGGIVGHINNTGTVENCYFCGKVTIAGAANYGGIVGEFADKATKIINCYSVGSLTCTDSASGNLNDAFGSVAKSAVITSCYALANGGNGFAGGTATNMDALSGYRSEAELKTRTTFSGWDFDGVWMMGTGDYLYPVLR